MPDKTLIIDFKTNDQHEPEHQVSSWRGFTVEHSILELPLMYDFTGVNSHQHYVAYHDLVLKDGELSIDGMPPVRGTDLRGKMTYIPAGRKFSGWSEPARKNNNFTILNFSPELVSEELEVMYSGQALNPQIYFQNDNLKSTMLKLQNLLHHNTPNSSLYMESLGLVAALEMAMAVPSLENVPKRGGLSKSQMHLLEDFIQANFARDITLDELAGMVGMSRFHFTRSFKESFGQSPIRYIIEQRLTFARMLLSQSLIPVSQIAVNSGFGSPQRFIKVFRQLTGSTPGEFRKQS